MLLIKLDYSQLGISEVFTDSAKLDGLFTSRTGQKISAAKHRGYINVNEAGSEAAAVTCKWNQLSPTIPY